MTAVSSCRFHFLPVGYHLSHIFLGCQSSSYPKFIASQVNVIIPEHPIPANIYLYRPKKSFIFQQRKGWILEMSGDIS